MSITCVEDIMSPFDLMYRDMQKWARQARVPLNAFFELTPLCNFHCPMCYVRLTPEMARAQGRILSAEEWLEIGRQLKDMGTFTVTLTGGEPLVHPGFWEIYEGLQKMGIYVTVFSNGALIDEEAAARFKAFPPRGIKLSLYGASDETYERMCGAKDGFTRVSHAIDALKAAGVPVYATSTIVRDNVQDLEAMYRFAEEKRILFSHSMDVSNNARGAASDPVTARLSFAERVKTWSPETLAKQRHPFPAKPFAFCRDFGAACHITWHGRMQVCADLASRYTQLTAPFDLPAAWQELLALADAIPFPEACATCEDREFCQFCPGGLNAESGDPAKITPAFCEKAALLHKAYLSNANVAADEQPEK